MERGYIPKGQDYSRGSWARLYRYSRSSKILPTSCRYSACTQHSSPSTVGDSPRRSAQCCSGTESTCFPKQSFSSLQQLCNLALCLSISHQTGPDSELASFNSWLSKRNYAPARWLQPLSLSYSTPELSARTIKRDLWSFF